MLDTCYCISSAQGTASTSTPATGGCLTTVTVNKTGAESCKTPATGVTAVYFCPDSSVTINCSATSVDPQYTVTANSGYSAVTGGSAISSAVAINKSSGTGSSVTVGACTYSDCH